MLLFSIRQRYKFESKSQQYFLTPPSKSDCFRYVKDTNLKANHNKRLPSFLRKLLFSIRQRYKFESKSQQHKVAQQVVVNCFRYVKDTNLKANHNLGRDVSSFVDIVFDTSKIQI